MYMKCAVLVLYFGNKVSCAVYIASMNYAIS